MTTTQSKPIESTDRAQPGMQLRSTDMQFRVLTDEQGNPTGQTVLVAVGDQGGPIDLFGSVDPRLNTPGLPTQRYYHTRTSKLVDLYVYENGGWGSPRLVGIMLNVEADLPTPPAPTFADFQDTDLGGTVRLVPAAGLAPSDYLAKITAEGPYLPAPVDGIISVGNVVGQVFAYAPATASRNQSPVASSLTFTTARVLPGGVSYAVPAPTFTNFQDTLLGGSVQLVPATGVPYADYLYKLGAGGTYASAPSDGVLNVGNFDGQVFAYSVASGLRSASLVAASPKFTSYTVLTPGSTTPQAPSFINFQDTNAGGSVQLVTILGIPLSDYRYKVGANGTYQNAPDDGIIVVADVAGSVYAYSVASGTRNQSPVGVSPSFTTSAVVDLPTLVSIALAGPASVNEGGTGTYTVTGTYSDGTTTTVTTGITWGSNTPNGVLTVPANSITGDGTTATVTATAGGQSDSKSVTIVDTTAPATSFTSTYTPTTADIAAKCANGGTGQPATRTGNTQAAADAAAKSAALAAISCNAPPENFQQTLNPGDNVATLTWGAAAGTLLKYNNPVQQVASAPGAVGTMLVFYPDLNTQVAQLNYDPLDEGHTCGVQIGATLYRSKVVSGANQTLTFTNGSVVIA